MVEGTAVANPSGQTVTARWRKFIGLSALDRRLLWRAWFALAFVQVSLLLLPSRWLLRGRVVDNPAQNPESIEKLVWSIRSAARFIPGATCLTQAIALQHLIARSGRVSRIQVGVRKDETARLRAHAWVEYEGRVVLGGSDTQQYFPLAAWETRASIFQ